MIRGTQGAAFLAAAIAGSFLATAAAADGPKTVQVDCGSSGKTIAKALEKGNEDRALLVLISGVCNENIVIDRADVTLRGNPSATISGPDASLNVVEVTADRVSIESLTVTGGRNGITATGAGNVAVRGSTVQSTGRTGILALAGSGLLVDGSTIQSNPRDGVVAEGSQMTVINSTIRQNGRFGVFVGAGASGRVGVDLQNNAAGSIVTQNGATGINVNTAGAALIGNNSITFNGQDLASTSGRSGISVIASSADILGSNMISDNTGQGIFVRGGSINIGNTSFAFSSTNTIQNNGDTNAAGGVFLFLGSTAVVRDAVITGNRGFGLGLTLRSQAQAINSQFTGNVSAGGFNTGDGVRVSLGSAVQFAAPGISVSSGNAGAGVFCSDAESSIQTLALDVSGGNTNGGVVNCTGF